MSYILIMQHAAFITMVVTISQNTNRSSYSPPINTNGLLYIIQ